MTGTADQLLLSTPVSQSNRLARFDSEVLTRGINSLKAARLLMEYGHWEHAGSVARQLFELLINMEHLARMDDRLEGMLLYLRFGALQVARQHQRTLLYNQSSGRAVDTESLESLERLIDTQFADFRGKPKHDGTPTWVPSWSRKNTKTLAELSNNPMRIHQHDHLYTSWSEQTHATPSSLLDNVFRETNEGWIDEVIESDDKQIIGTSSMTLMLFLELWEILPHAAARPGDRAREWAREIMQMVAAPEFNSLPGYR
ncbi:DUF5677 domain-containing protein [Streptomyces sp. NRRL S-448]|uniref:DUF5677 domain-containing protein n=1 Tax=Streptomyces sp. NRRL S-448 TaxID=1463907 RepID=UPI0035697962